MEMTEELKNYQNHIEFLAENREAITIYNSSPEHAVIIMSTIFRHSNDTIRVFADNFNGNISNKEIYQHELENFIFRGGKLNVLLQSFDESNNEQLFRNLSIYKSAFPDNIEVKTTNKKLFQKGEGNALNEVNFTVADHCFYRLEEDTHKKLARCSFNDPKISIALENIFDEIFNSEDSETIYKN